MRSAQKHEMLLAVKRTPPSIVAANVIREDLQNPIKLLYRRFKDRPLPSYFMCATCYSDEPLHVDLMYGKLRLVEVVCYLAPTSAVVPSVAYQLVSSLFHYY
ncbi:hypothetical protein Zmor_003996 [Zophobas morio]|uniref:Uncharacterized protein n=1 Tax=Zophobas morio TaxID=2755281 RepID=A0AA38M124_9CUCU|nr:hypothetical protein Zmor_003996 [Zophobas morio]